MRRRLKPRPDDDPITPGDLRQASAANASLLRLGAYCRIHLRGYGANRMVGNHVEAADCPWCIKEREWVRRARETLRAEGTEITGPVLLARAEELAGMRLQRYMRYDESQP